MIPYLTLAPSIASVDPVSDFLEETEEIGIISYPDFCESACPFHKTILISLRYKEEKALSVPVSALF